RGLSLVAIVVGGLMFAFGEGQSKRTLAGIIFGVGMAVGAVNFMAWVFPLKRVLRVHFWWGGNQSILFVVLSTSPSQSGEWSDGCSFWPSSWGAPHSTALGACSVGSQCLLACTPRHSG